MLLEDHQYIHLYRFHTCCAEEDGEEVYHALEEAHVLNHEYQASSDVEVDGYMVE